MRTQPYPGISTVLIAFCVLGAESEEAAQNLLFDRMPSGDAPLTSDPDGVQLDSWWVAEDTRFDRSDCDSAVFVNPGKQAEARALLVAAGLAH